TPPARLGKCSISRDVRRQYRREKQGLAEGRTVANAQLGLLLRHIHRLHRAEQTAGDGDAELLARFITRHDEDAFDALVRRHGPMVLGVCRRLLGDAHAAEDAFQATFLVLVRRAATLDRPELLGNWLHGVAARVAREARARTARRRTQERQAQT